MALIVALSRGVLGFLRGDRRTSCLCRIHLLLDQLVDRGIGLVRSRLFILPLVFLLALPILPGLFTLLLAFGLGLLCRYRLGRADAGTNDLITDAVVDILPVIEHLRPVIEQVFLA